MRPTIPKSLKHAACSETDAKGNDTKFCPRFSHRLPSPKLPWASEEMMSYERALGEGYFAVCSHHVELLTGRPALSLRDVFIANRDALTAKSV